MTGVQTCALPIYGKTWSKPRDITKDISFPEWPFGKAHNAGGFIFMTSGSGMQAKDGTLVHTIVHVGDGNALFGSEDHGKTWKAFGKPAKNGDECKVVELSDGSWMINSRWRGGGGRYTSPRTAVRRGSLATTRRSPTPSATRRSCA